MRVKKGASAETGSFWSQRVAIQSFRKIAIIFLAICLVIGIICAAYYGQLQTTIRSESSAYLQEIANRISGSIDKIIDDTYAMLYSVSDVLRIGNPLSFEEFETIADEQQIHWKYQSILLIDADGNAYDRKGKSIALNGDVYLRDVLLEKRSAMSPMQVLKDEEVAIFAVPLSSLQVGGIEMGALAVAYDVETFSGVLSMSAFSNRAYSHIVSKDGSIIIRSNSADGVSGYNVLASIESDPANKNVDIAELKQNMRIGQTGQIDFSLNGERMYLVYCPVTSADWYLYTFVPAAVVNARSNILLTLTLVMSGFITLTFATLGIILIRSFQAYKHKLEQIAYVDPVTNGNTSDRFYEMAAIALAAPEHPPFALVFTNLEKFKVLNENYGRKMCDEILRILYDAVSCTLTGSECMGRISADNFCVLLEYQNAEVLAERFEQWHAYASEFVTQHNTVWALPVAEFGVYVIDNETMPFPQMIDRAKLALRETPRTINSKLRFAIYTDEVRRKLFREKHLEDMMEGALAEREFQMFLQPKFSVFNEEIAGAEALCRWVSKEEGMIYPNEFIPLFEKNGFIIRLDLWMFEEVCRTIRSWMDTGRPLIKISVNCSRMHLKDPDFLRLYRKIADFYHVPTDLVEIELTENIVLEDSQRFQNTVEEIHEAGFGCSMDDFGSGYSSLNLIQDISVDTLKLDKIFFRDTTRDPLRTESVLATIVGMAKALSMETVAEGVERYEQVDMLRRIGCDLIQGFVFAKPMSLADFEALMDQKKNKGE